MPDFDARQYGAHIGGQWVAGEDGSWLTVEDPADRNSVIARVPALDSHTVSNGYAAARVGARIWGSTNHLERGIILYRVAAILRERGEQLAVALSRENGKTLDEARGEIGKSADFFEFYAATARLPYGEMLNDSREGTTTSMRREPVGVVLAITPWNDPLLTPARKIAPALAYGNSVVLKPASQTPAIAIELTQILLDAGVPPQTISLVTGRSQEISEALISSEEIDAVTFTGSTSVGLGLQRSLAGRNLRVQTEMGGKNASIVLSDCDLALAAQTIASASFGQGGQRCTATSRVIVESSVKDELLDRLVERASEVRMGAGTDTDTTLGPLISPSHQTAVLKDIEESLSEGAKLVYGGSAPSEDRLSAGCFVEPTIIETDDPNTALWENEIFGPVIAVFEVQDLGAAIRLTNDSIYGLAAALFTNSLAASDRFLREVEAGQAAVNLPTTGWDVHLPFGGIKLSGSPFKEQGLEAASFYTRIKTCAVRST